MGALVDAVQQGDAAAVQRLVEADRRVADERDDNGISALMHALYRGHRKIAGRIADAKGWLDVFEAAALGDAGRLELALAERPEDLRARSADGFTALHFAAFFGHRIAANILLLAGADVNAEAGNVTRVRPLHSAVAGPNPMMAETLLAMGADVNAAQQGGYTALHSAAKHGNLPLVNLLLRAGADPNLRTDEGGRPSDLARNEGHSEVAELLDSRGAGGPKA